MINFFEIDIRRAACHGIDPKKTGLEHATVLVDNQLCDISQEVFELIKDRLAKAAERETKAFQLEIEYTNQASFFGLCHDLKNQSDEEFLNRSQEIAHLLAEAQTKNTIPGGNLIFLEAVDQRGRTAYIVIKAETIFALRYEIINRQSKVRMIQDLFMSQQQKMYKFGIIYERGDEEKELYKELAEPNFEFGCFLFDDQFNVGSKLAEYFYKDFLGFSIDSNPKIQSKKFYVNTENFIKSNLETQSEKEELLKVLKLEFLDHDESDKITPKDFADLYIHEPAVNSLYHNEIAQYLPDIIMKDTSLIKNNLQRKKYAFPNDIVITGPNNTFDINVKIVKSMDDLKDVDFSNRDYTIVKILGKPEQEK